jgi:hypothetical protein
VGDIPNSYSARHGGGERLKMRDLALVPGLILLPGNDSDRVDEAADIDKPEVEREERGAGNEPDDDQGKFGVSDRDRIEDDIRESLGDGAKSLIDCFVDSQGVLLVSRIVWRTLAADCPSTIVFVLRLKGFRIDERAKVPALRGLEGVT